MSFNKLVVRSVGVLAFMLMSCSENYLPKPKGYNVIELPEHKFVQMQEQHPYTFEHSVYSKLMPHNSRITEEHWIDIYYPKFDATVQLTYKRLDEGNKTKDLKAEFLQEIEKDARKLTSQHNVKAYSIEERSMVNPQGVTTYLFELDGEVPSQFQFFCSDSTENFLRGALYFKESTKNDSLAPVIEFVKYDIIHMLNTLDWK